MLRRPDLPGGAENDPSKPAVLSANGHATKGSVDVCLPEGGCPPCSCLEDASCLEERVHGIVVEPLLRPRRLVNLSLGHVVDQSEFRGPVFTELLNRKPRSDDGPVQAHVAERHRAADAPQFGLVPRLAEDGVAVRAVAETEGNVAICRLGVAQQLRNAQTGWEHLWAAVARPRELADEGRPRPEEFHAAWVAEGNALRDFCA